MDNNSNEFEFSLTLFGATGDLAKRKLYPALFNLYKRNLLKKNFSVIGASRLELTDDEFMQVVKKSLIQFSAPAAVETIDEFISHFSYIPQDVTDEESYTILKSAIKKKEKEFNTDNNRIFYMSVSPKFFETIAINIKKSGLLTDDGYNRLMIEKPFGTNFRTANELEEVLEHSFKENQIFRIDHYLGKEMVQNIAPLRFANPFFKASWNKENIKNIQVTLSETLGVEERAGYYDTVGALLDMIQNHAMQLVDWVAMETPESFSDEDVRKAKHETFKHLKMYTTPEEVNKNFVRGQYGSGTGTGEIPYNRESGVPTDSKNNTFIAGKLEFDTDRWRGVPFYVRSGKKLSSKTTRIDIIFKNAEKDYKKSAPMHSPVLSFIIDPVGSIELVMNGKENKENNAYNLLPLDWKIPKDELKQIPTAYERLFYDTMSGNLSNFASWGDVAVSWKFIDHISDVFKKNSDNLYIYPQYSMGPKESDELLSRNGDKWFFKG